jgi:hypothetical protein
MKFVLLLPLVAGCATGLEVHRVVTGTPGRAHSDEVVLLPDETPSPGEVDEVARLQAVGKGVAASREAVLQALRADAQQLGCDVVMRVHVEQRAAEVTASGVAARSRWSATRRWTAPPWLPPPSVPMARAELPFFVGQ